MRLANKLKLLAEMTGKGVREERVRVTIAPKHKFKYSFVMTDDEAAQNYSSSLIIAKSEPLWAFHLIWVSLDGDFKSTTAAHRVKLGRCKLEDYGTKFLKTFNTVMERASKVSGLLGQMNLLQGHPRWTPKDMLNVLLMNTYGRMWDMDVEVEKFEDIPKDVVDDFHAFVDQEFGLEDA